MEYRFSDSQIDTVRRALEHAAIDNRMLIRDAIERGSAAVAGFYATKLVRLERATHTAWGMENYFPSAE